MKIKDCDTIYHYCGIDAFIGIIKSRTIFLSQVSTMNDVTEYKLLQPIANRKRVERINSLDDGHFFEDERAIRLRLYEAIGHRLSNFNPPDPYCACFSRRGDVLSQWREYADRGRGFSIGFDATNIPDEWNRREKGNLHSIGSVKYGSITHDHFVEASFLNVEAEVDEVGKWDERDRRKIDDQYFKAKADEFVNEVMYHAIYCKNEAFEEEDEIRAVIEKQEYANSPATECDVRARGPQLIHHLIMPLARLFGPTPIIRIYLGPMNPLLHNRKPLDLMLADRGMSKVEILESAARLAS